MFKVGQRVTYVSPSTSPPWGGVIIGVSYNSAYKIRWGRPSFMYSHLTNSITTISVGDPALTAAISPLERFVNLCSK